MFRPIKCPVCGKEKNLSLYILVESASIRIPIVKTVPKPCFEVLLEKPLASNETLVNYSDVSGETRITLHKDGMKILVNCPWCDKMHTLPEGTDIKCNDAS